MSLTLESACKEGYLSDVKRIVHSGMDAPSNKLKAIRVAAAKKAEVIRSNIAQLREENVNLFMQFSNDDDLSKEQVVKIFKDAEDDVTRLPSADDVQQLDETARIVLRQRPKIVRDYIKKFTELTGQLQKEDHAASNAESVAVDERSDTVSLIVVDYVKPGNGEEPVLSAEARSSRQLLEHMVIAQHGQITELRDQFCALIGTLTSHAEKQAQEMAKLMKHNEQIMSEVLELKEEVSQLQEDLDNRPLVVSLKDHATAEECFSAGYDASALLRAGFSFKDLLDAGYTSKDLKLADISFYTIAMNGFGCGPLLAEKLITWADVEKEWGVSKTSTQERLLEAGITFSDLFKSGYWTLAELKVAFSAKTISEELKKIGINPQPKTKLQEMCLWIQMLKSRGWRSEIKDILQITNPTEGKKLGLTLSDMRDIGFTCGDMCDTGNLSGKPFTSAEIAQVYGFNVQLHNDLNSWTPGWRLQPFLN